MDATHSPLFCSVDLAARIELAAAMLIAAGVEAARRRDGAGGQVALPIAGGIAAWAGPESPFNKVAGVGFAGDPTAAELEAVESAFATRGAPVQVELASLAEAGIGEGLAERGYRFTGFENVLGTRLPSPVARRDLKGHDVREGTAAELEAWVDSMVDGFASPDTQGVASHESFPRAVIEQAMRDLSTTDGFTRYLARLDGEIAGGGGMYVGNGIAQLSGAATLPAYRRRGAQTALLTVRLAAAARAGCDLAVITTQPGSKSQENAQRQGFELLFTRAIMLRLGSLNPGDDLLLGHQ
jgi:ribosomal protein S18 acetylase RimI-like enzyme